VVIDSAPNNVVGGTAAGARNVISGNAFSGVVILSPDASGNRVEGNYVGTDTSGTQDLGNVLEGVVIGNAPNNVVGGTSASARNLVSGNDRDGVRVVNPSATGNRILRNSVFDNGALGINLDFDGVTANDPGDLDTGPNNLQNYPVITSATTYNGQTTIQGTLNSTPYDAFNLQFFSSPAADDPSRFGEGETYVGQTNVVANAEGNAAFIFTTNTPISGGQVVTTTATNSVTYDTSEFSEAVAVEDDTPPPPPAPQCSDGADNDMDGKIDSGDSGCESATDGSESPDPIDPSGDTTAPTIQFKTPADNGIYKLNEKVVAKYTCADEKGGSGLELCKGDKASGSLIDTSKEGTYTFTVTAKDYAGNTKTEMHTYSVTKKSK